MVAVRSLPADPFIAPLVELSAMTRRLPLALSLGLSLSIMFQGLQRSATAAPPNVLFIIADDASARMGEAYPCPWIRTPHIDQLARDGVVFERAYVPTSKCAPCRAGLLTGRNPWQLEEAANHQCVFPHRFKAFTEALAEAGVHCGSVGKTWGPGQAQLADGRNRDFALPRQGQAGPQLARSFESFLDARPAGQPFFFWYGSSDPHRAYELGAGLKAGKRLADIEHVPAYWPDNDVVRSDMLDYATEVEAFDRQVGTLLEVLAARGEAGNTLVVVTSDHGMPFPRVKGHTYEEAHHVPLVLRGPVGIVQPGRRIPDLVSLIDLAPTFLELLAVDGPASGMSPLTGQSLTDLLRGAPSRERPFVVIGRERNDAHARPGSPGGLGYPARALRQGDFLYVHNFAPDRWPCGDPDLGLKDTDNGPTKQLVEMLGPTSIYWQHAFGMRPQEQLFDVRRDPDCVQNLAADPAYQDRTTELRDTLLTELRRQHDPRVLGQGDLFDQYPTVKPPAKPAPAPRRRRN